MLKQILNIFIAFMLLIATSGVVLHQHYCHGTFTHTAVQILPEDCCAKDCGHCHNETSLIKITDSFTPSYSSVSAPVQIQISGIINNMLLLFVTEQHAFQSSDFLFVPPKLYQITQAFLQIYLL